MVEMLELLRHAIDDELGRGSALDGLCIVNLFKEARFGRNFGLTGEVHSVVRRDFEHIHIIRVEPVLRGRVHGGGFKGIILREDNLTESVALQFNIVFAVFAIYGITGLKVRGINRCTIGRFFKQVSG